MYTHSINISGAILINMGANICDI